MKYSKEDAFKMIKLFRFRTKKPSDCKYYYMKIKDIAQFLNKSSTYVSRICK